MFWIENVPLNGTSQISIQAVDAAGNMTTNNLTIMPSALTLTINSTPTGDDLCQPSGTVSGTVGDPDAVVTVNGVPTTVDDRYANADGTYNWSADNVPIYGMGTATFDATATPGPGSGMGMARAMDSDSGSPAANVSLEVEMGPIIEVTHYSYTEADEYAESWEGELQFSTSETRTASYDGQFAPNASGQWVQTYQATETIMQSRTADNGTSCGTNVQSWSDPEPFDVAEIFGYDDDGNCFAVGHSFAKTVHHHWNYTDAYGDFCWSDATVNANTRWTLYTGGKAPLNPSSQFAPRASAAPGSQPQDLFALSAGAYSYEGPPDGVTAGSPRWGWPGAPINGVLGPSIQMLGQPLGSDFNLWTTLPENGAIDLALTVLKVNDDGSWAAFTKYHPYINLITSTTNADLDTDTPEICVGQQVNFEVFGLPPFQDSVQHWSLPGQYVNQQTNYSTNCTTYVRNDDLLADYEQQCWYTHDPGGTVSVGLNLHMPNGSYVGVAADGNFTVYRPQKVQFTSYPPFNPTIYTNKYGFSVLGLGDWDTKEGIMAFQAVVQSKKPYLGSTAWTQLVNAYVYQNRRTGTRGHYWLDNGEFYVGTSGFQTNTANTGTSTNLFRDAPTVAPTVKSVTENFKTYRRFSPPDGIWVTLGIVNWGWGATNQNGSLLPPSVTAPTYSDPVEFPVWRKTAYNGKGF